MARAVRIDATVVEADIQYPTDAGLAWQGARGEPTADRLVSVSDPDTRPIRKGKLGKPNQSGYVAQLAEVTANTRRGARGYVLPAASAPGNPGENACFLRPPPSWTGSA